MMRERTALRRNVVDAFKLNWVHTKSQKKMMDVLDTDGDEEVSRDEFFALADYGMEDVYLEKLFDLYDTTLAS